MKKEEATPAPATEWEKEARELFNNTLRKINEWDFPPEPAGEDAWIAAIAAAFARIAAAARAEAEAVAARDMERTIFLSEECNRITDKWREAFARAANLAVDNWERDVSPKIAGIRMDRIINMLLERAPPAAPAAEALAVIDAARADGAGWQTMDSAPKDGRWFIGWVEEQPEPTLYRWSEATMCFAPIVAELELELTGSNDGHYEPTHWQPLPLPPPSPGAEP